MTLDHLTRDELARAARAVIRRYLDVETGHRPPEELGQLLSPAAAADLRTHQAPPGSVGRPPRAADLGPASVLRLDSARAYVCAAARVPGTAEWTTIAVELTADQERLRVDRVGRVAADISREATAEPPARVGNGQPPPQTPRHLAGLLGDLPISGEAQARWLTAAAVIDTYRERYDIHDDRSALGAEPRHPEQAAERQRAVDYIRALVREIDRDAPDRTRSREEPGRDLGR